MRPRVAVVLSVAAVTLAVRPVAAQVTTRVSLNSNGQQAAGGLFGSRSASISADGRFVAFHSDSERFRSYVSVHEHTPPPGCPGDANRDGLVHFSDITSILENWNAVCR